MEQRSPVLLGWRLGDLGGWVPLSDSFKLILTILLGGMKLQRFQWNTEEQILMS